MPAEIHKQILDYQGGDANAALELVEKFKPLIKRYAFFLHREDSFKDLQCFLLSMLKTWDTSRLSSTDDATVTRYIANSVKNEYIALSKQKAKERGTSYLEDATLQEGQHLAMHGEGFRLHAQREENVPRFRGKLRLLHPAGLVLLRAGHGIAQRRLAGDPQPAA